MTNVTVFGEDASSKKDKKPIEFVIMVSEGKKKLLDTKDSVKLYRNIMLLIKTQQPNAYDVMYAFDEDRINDGRVYLGYWNDGVIE